MHRMRQSTLGSPSATCPEELAAAGYALRTGSTAATDSPPPAGGRANADFQPRRYAKPAATTATTALTLAARRGMFPVLSQSQVFTLAARCDI